MKYSKFHSVRKNISNKIKIIGLIWIGIAILSLSIANARMIRSEEKNLIQNTDEVIQIFKSEGYNVNWKNVPMYIQKKLVEILAEELDKHPLDLNWQDFNTSIEEFGGHTLGGLLEHYSGDVNIVIGKLFHIPKLYDRSVVSYWINRMEEKKIISWKEMPKNVQKDLVHILSKEVGKEVKELTKNDFKKSIPELGNWPLLGLLNQVYSGNVRLLKKELGFK